MPAPSHTPAPWSMHHPFDSWPMVRDSNGVNIAKTDCSLSSGSWVEDVAICKANARLISAAPALLAALQAQELTSEIQNEVVMRGAYPQPDDQRYTPFIGEWDGYQAPEVRFRDLAMKRREMRRAALKQALNE